MPTVGVEFAKVSYTLPRGADGQAGRSLLRDISLQLEAGTTTALLGRSGSGKTTLLRMVNGLVSPTSGEVRVAGKATRDYNAMELRRRIGYVIQETGLFPHMTVERNAGMALELAGGPSRRLRRGCARCWRLWGWSMRSFARGIRGSFRVGRGSGSGWRERWRRTRWCC